LTNGGQTDVQELFSPPGGNWGRGGGGGAAHAAGDAVPDVYARHQSRENWAESAAAKINEEQRLARQVELLAMGGAAPPQQERAVAPPAAPRLAVPRLPASRLAALTRAPA